MPKAAEGENDDALNADLSTSTLFGVQGKVVLVTGGGSGIGAMIAAGYVRSGCRVYIASRKDCSPYAAELTKTGPGSCVALTCDIGVLKEQEAMLDAIKKAEGKLHVLINNSGTNFNAPLGQYKPEMFEKVMQVNTNAVFSLVQLAAPLLEASSSHEDPGRVVNIASIDGIGVPKMDTFAYSTSKAAVIMLSRHLAGALGPKHITVNSVCPGPFMSRMMRGTIKAAGEGNIVGGTAVGRMGSTEDVAGTCIFLSSRAGAFITGTEVVVDGGVLVSRSRM